MFFFTYIFIFIYTPAHHVRLLNMGLGLNLKSSQKRNKRKRLFGSSGPRVCRKRNRKLPPSWALWGEFFFVVRLFTHPEKWWLDTQKFPCFFGVERIFLKEIPKHQIFKFFFQEKQYGCWIRRYMTGRPLVWRDGIFQLVWWLWWGWDWSLAAKEPKHDDVQQVFGLLTEHYQYCCLAG